MPGVTVLVTSTVPLIAGLLSDLTRAAGHTPVVPDAAESPADALARTSPLAVLVDCTPGQCPDAEFIEAARSTGATVVLFSPSMDMREVRAVARAWRVRWLPLPIRRARLDWLLSLREPTPTEDARVID